METNIYLYGASGHCKVIIDILHSMKEGIEGILDDAPKAYNLFDIPVFNSMDHIDLTNKKFIISIGNNAIRKNIANGLRVDYHTAIHSKAIVSKYAKIAGGTVVMAGAIINPDAVIGKHCIINTGAIIEHDCVIQDYVHVAPNASLAGHVTIEEGSHIGIGASVIQGIRIGKWAVIGAGAVIIKDVPDHAIVVGTPGKIIKIKDLQ